MFLFSLIELGNKIENWRYYKRKKIGIGVAPSNC